MRSIYAARMNGEEEEEEEGKGFAYVAFSVFDSYVSRLTLSGLFTKKKKKKRLELPTLNLYGDNYIPLSKHPNKHILSVFSIITPNYVKVPLCKQEAERCHDLQWGFSLLASIAAGHCTPSCSLTVKVNLQVSHITSHAGWAFHLPFGVFAQSGASGSFTQTTATHVGWRSTKHWR